MAGEKDLAALQVSLELQTAAFEAGVKQVDRQLKRMEKNTNRTNQSFASLQKNLSRLGGSLAGLAAALGVNQFISAADNAIEYADSIAKVSDKVGVTVVELQALRFAADQAGVGARTLDMALQRFARRMGEAAAGTGELSKTANELGIVFKNQDGSWQSTTQLLLQYADAIAAAETQQEALRLTFKAFDSEGAALTTLFQNGAQGLRDYLQVVDEFNLAIGEDTARSAEQIGDRLGFIEQQFKVFTTETLVAASEAVLEFFGIFSDAGRAQEELERIEAQIANVKETMADPDISEGFLKKLEQALPALEAQSESLREELRILGALEVEQSFAEMGAEAEKTTKNFSKVVKAIQEFEDPLKKYKDQIAEINEAARAGAISGPQAAAAIARIGIEAYYATEPVGQFDMRVEALMETFDAFAGKSERLGDLYEALRRFEDLGDTVSADAVWEAIADEEGFGEVEETLEKLEDKTQTTLEKIEEQMDGFVRDFTNTFVDGLLEGEMAFDDFAKNILSTIAKMLLNDLFTQFFQIIYGGIKGSLGIPVTPAIADSTLKSLATYSQPTSGMTRAGEASTMMVGQVVGKASATSPSNKSPVTVNVNNYGSDEVTVAERQDGNGGIDIDVFIKSKVREGMAGGDFDKVFSSSFGLRRMGY